VLQNGYFPTLPIHLSFAFNMGWLLVDFDELKSLFLLFKMYVHYGKRMWLPTSC
jgi:hypothetical protein